MSTDFLLQGRRIKTPIFDSSTDIMTDLANSECVVTDGTMLYSWVLFGVYSRLFCE